MRKKLLSLCVTFFVAAVSISQGLTITPGAVVKTTAGVNIVMQRATLTNNGSGDLSNSSLYMRGDTIGNIGGTTAISVANLYIDNGSSIVSLGNDLSVSNNVVFQNGLLDLNGHNLLLGPNGLLVNESETNHVTGPLGGYVSIIVDLNAPAGANPGNLGAIITSSKDLGRVLIERAHTSQTNQGSGKSILRYYVIQPTNNSALSAVFRFTYLDGELNGLTEGTLSMWRSTNDGASWAKVTAVGQSTSLNFIDVNQNNFSRYTLSSPSFSFTNSTQGVSATDTRSSELNKVSLMLMPNPVGAQATVLINSTIAFKTEVGMFAIDGKKLARLSIQLHPGMNQATINTSGLAAGLYYLMVQMQDGTTRKIPFAKQ